MEPCGNPPDCDWITVWEFTGAVTPVLPFVPQIPPAVHFCTESARTIPN
jgi:hypothetical protein